MGMGKASLTSAGLKRNPDILSIYTATLLVNGHDIGAGTSLPIFGHYKMHSYPQS